MVDVGSVVASLVVLAHPRRKSLDSWPWRACDTGSTHPQNAQISSHTTISGVQHRSMLWSSKGNTRAFSWLIIWGGLLDHCLACRFRTKRPDFLELAGGSRAERQRMRFKYQSSSHMREPPEREKNLLHMLNHCDEDTHPVRFRSDLKKLDQSSANHSIRGNLECPPTI